MPPDSQQASDITWAVNGLRQATVFCSHCRAVFAQDIPTDEARDARDAAQAVHHCAPTPPFRPGQP